MEISEESALWVQENIMVQWVHADPSFAYTFGLWNAHLPELIIVGMPFRQAGMTLNLIAAAMHANGPFRVGDLDTDIFTLPTKFGSVSTEEIEEKMTQTIAHARDGRGDVLQVLWPDRRGIFPDEPGYSVEFASQKVLA